MGYAKIVASPTPDCVRHIQIKPMHMRCRNLLQLILWWSSHLVVVCLERAPFCPTQRFVFPARSAVFELKAKRFVWQVLERLSAELQSRHGHCLDFQRGDERKPASISLEPIKSARQLFLSLAEVSGFFHDAVGGRRVDPPSVVLHCGNCVKGIHSPPLDLCAATCHLHGTARSSEFRRSSRVKGCFSGAMCPT